MFVFNGLIYCCWLYNIDFKWHIDSYALLTICKAEKESIYDIKFIVNVVGDYYVLLFVV